MHNCCEKTKLNVHNGGVQYIENLITKTKFSDWCGLVFEYFSWKKYILETWNDVLADEACDQTKVIGK